MADVNRVVIHGVQRTLDWKPDDHDPRDFKFEAPSTVTIPDTVNLTRYESPIKDQGQEGCHDDQTEILTELGWKFFSELTGNERLLTVDPRTRNAVFERPTRLIRYHYVGNLIRSSTRSVDFAVTPNHRMLIKKWDELARTLKSDFEFVRADELGWYFGFMGTFKIDNEGQEFYELPGRQEAHLKQQQSPSLVPMAAWLRFLGIYLAEGTIRSHIRKDRAGKVEMSIQLAAVKPRERQFIQQVLTDLGIENYCSLKDRFVFYNRQIVQALLDLGLGGVRAGKKFVPNFVFKQKVEHIKEFLLGHFMGDGCEGSTTPCHYTSSSQLADGIHALLLFSGRQSRVTVRMREGHVSQTMNGRYIRSTLPEHKIGVVQKRSDPSLTYKKNVFKEFYSGEVFCAEVPSYHTLVTRRNGKVLISGNSCTGFGISGLLEFKYWNLPTPQKLIFSPQFIYYNERVVEGTLNEDSGAQIRTGMKVIANQGCCTETAWPYHDTPEEMVKKPSDAAFREAASYKISSYLRVTGLSGMLSCLAQKHPFTCGILLYESFDSDAVARTGMVPMPGTREQMLGGHCVDCVGYSKPHKLFIMRNSWSRDWGVKGHFYLPFDYLSDSNLGSDMWTLRG